MAKPQTSLPTPEKPGRIRLKSVEFVSWAQVTSNQVERIKVGDMVGGKKLEELFLENGLVHFGDYIVPLSNVKSAVRA